MANIFFRYGDVRDLRFVLSGGINLGWPSKFRITHPLGLYSHPDILCSHPRFSKKPMNWLFPPETSKYATILRNLVDNFETVFNFYHLREVFGIEATRTIPWRNSWKNQCHITLSTAADFRRA